MGLKVGQATQTGGTGSTGSKEHRPEPVASSHAWRAGQHRAPARAAVFSMERHSHELLAPRLHRRSRGWGRGSWRKRWLQGGHAPTE